jgi:hypothetical protein
MVTRCEVPGLDGIWGHSAFSDISQLGISINHSFQLPFVSIYFKMHLTTALTGVLFASNHLPFSLASVIDFSPAPISLLKRDLASLCQPSAGVSNLVDSPFPCNKMQGVMQICGLSVDLDGLNPTADHLSKQQKCLCDSNGKGSDVWRYTQGLVGNTQCRLSKSLYQICC